MRPPLDSGQTRASVRLLKVAIRGSLALGVVLVMLVVVLMRVLALVMMTDGRRERTRCNKSHNHCHEKNPDDLAHTNSPCVVQQTFHSRSFPSAIPTTLSANERINTQIGGRFRGFLNSR